MNLTFHADAESRVRAVDIIDVHMPLHPSAVVRALKSGHIADYAGDAWFPQPAPPDHPWRTMAWNGMMPPISGSSLSAQARCAAGTLEILESHFGGTPIREEYLIVDSGVLAGAGAQSYKLT